MKRLIVEEVSLFSVGVGHLPNSLSVIRADRQCSLQVLDRIVVAADTGQWYGEIHLCYEPLIIVFSHGQCRIEVVNCGVVIIHSDIGQSVCN